MAKGRKEDQHPDELRVSKEHVLNKVETTTCRSLCDKQRWLSQRLEAQRLQLIEFTDYTTESCASMQRQTRNPTNPSSSTEL